MVDSILTEDPDYRKKVSLAHCRPTIEYGRAMAFVEPLPVVPIIRATPPAVTRALAVVSYETMCLHRVLHLHHPDHPGRLNERPVT